MDFNTLKKTDREYIANTYKRVDLDIFSGSGAACKNKEGEEIIDFSSGIGVNSLGFCSENWKNAVIAQLDKLNHISNIFYSHPQVELAEKLCTKTGVKKVFFGNSGAEANEGAIKTARKYSQDKYGDNRYEIITLKNSFHGRTIATLSATGQDVFHKYFGPFVDGFSYADANNIDSVKSLITSKTCAVMIEVIQGEGGVLALDYNFVKDIAEICKEKDILLIVDEVQTGVGRTGKFLCCEYYDINPDIVTLAKGLGGGLPIGAVLFGEKTKDTLGFSDHGTTFGGNPIVTAGAVAVVDTINNDFLNDVNKKAEVFISRLLKMPHVVSISGKGLMIGIAFDEGFDARKIAEKCAKNGLIVLTAKDKLRLLPPLNITEDQIETGLNKLENILKSMK